jgi:hypothetical protein
MPFKFLFALLAFITAIKLSAQKIEFKNLTVSDENSKTIYLDIENKFKIAGFIEQLHAASNNLSYTLHEDTLILVPVTRGYIMLSFATKYGTQQILFTAKELPMPALSIGGETNKLIPKAVCLNNGQISLQKNDLFFENYKVDSSVININGQTFTVDGDKLPDELLAAINKAKSGDKLQFTYVSAVNPKNGMRITNPGKVSYELK